MSTVYQFDSYGEFGGLPPTFSYQNAAFCAEQLSTLPGVSEVLLFGGITEELYSHEINLLIVVNNEMTYQDFLRRVRGKIVDDFLGHLLGTRLRLCAILEIWPAVEHFWSPEFVVDLLVVPQNWKSRLDQLQANLPHEDPEFMNNLARDARPIATHP